MDFLLFPKHLSKFLLLEMIIMMPMMAGQDSKNTGLNTSKKKFPYGTLFSDGTHPKPEDVEPPGYMEFYTPKLIPNPDPEPEEEKPRKPARVISPIEEALSKNDDKKVIELITQDKKLATQPLFKGCAPIHMAASRGNLELVNFLIEKGANVNQNLGGSIPLNEALRSGNRELVRFLIIEKKANVNVDAKDIDIPLHVAVQGGDVAMVELLIKKGAKVNEADPVLGKTALHKAVDNGSKEMVELLMKNGADAKQVDKYKRTPNSYAKELDAQIAHHNKFVDYVKTLPQAEKKEIQQYRNAATSFEVINLGNTIRNIRDQKRPNTLWENLFKSRIDPTKKNSSMADIVKQAQPAKKPVNVPQPAKKPVNVPGKK